MNEAIVGFLTFIQIGEATTILELIPVIEGVSTLTAVILVCWLIWRAVSPILARGLEIIKEYLEKQQAILEQNTAALQNIVAVAQNIDQSQRAILEELRKIEGRQTTLEMKVDLILRRETAVGDKGTP